MLNRARSKLGGSGFIVGSRTCILVYCLGLARVARWKLTYLPGGEISGFEACTRYNFTPTPNIKLLEMEIQVWFSNSYEFQKFHFKILGNGEMIVL